MVHAINSTALLPVKMADYGSVAILAKRLYLDIIVAIDRIIITRMVHRFLYLIGMIKDWVIFAMHPWHSNLHRPCNDLFLARMVEWYPDAVLPTLTKRVRRLSYVAIVQLGSYRSTDSFCGKSETTFQVVAQETTLNVDHSQETTKCCSQTHFFKNIKSTGALVWYGVWYTVLRLPFA